VITRNALGSDGAQSTRMVTRALIPSLVQAACSLNVNPVDAN
jgi:hypothetical protein